MKTQKTTIKNYLLVKTNNKSIERLCYNIQSIYDNSGKIQYEIHRGGQSSDSKKPTISKYLFKYEDGKRTELLFYHPLNNLYRKDYMFCEDKSNPIKCDSYIKGKLAYKTTWQYDDQGRETQ